MLQSLGLPRLVKYEAHNGPGIDAITTLLKNEADPHSLERYASTLMFSWIVLSTDGHAKNHSVFIQPDGATLTPLYDASSLVPYLGSDSSLDTPSLLLRAADRKLAVKYGASDRTGDVGRFELGRIAERCGMPADHLLALTATYLIEIADVMADAASTMPPRLQTDTIARAVEWMPKRARQAAEALDIGNVVDA